MPTLDRLQDAIDAFVPAIAEIRHDLHAHPELGYEETRTSGVVQRELAAMGIQFAAGLAGGTGVLGYLPASRDPERAPTIALRADMDALPIEEATGLPYSSTRPGIMHACGHDGHTSMLLGAALALSRAERPNNVLLVFQPAEEGGAGAKRMCDDGVLDGRVLGKPVDMMFGQHGSPLLGVGVMGTRAGAMMASADGFDVVIHGKGGHGAQPHTGIDPVVVAAHIIVALQTIASRNVSPLEPVVVTIGQIEAGSARNIIPEEARLWGTLRALSEPTRTLGKRRVEEIVSQTAATFGATTELSWNMGYPVTVNHEAAVRRFRTVVGAALPGVSQDDMGPTMGAEDFSYYGRQVPACFFWQGLLGEGEDRYPNLHAPNFDFNDRALPVGIRAFCELALAPL